MNKTNKADKTFAMIGPKQRAMDAGAGFKNLVTLSKPKKGQRMKQVVAVLMVFVVIAVVVFAALFGVGWWEGYNKQEAIDEHVEQHTADEAIPILPLTVGVMINLPGEQYTNAVFYERGMGKDLIKVYARLYDPDDDVDNSGEKTAPYKMITNKSYAIDVIENIRNPSLTQLSQETINDRGQFKVWCNNEVRQQPFTDYAWESDPWFQYKVKAEYMISSSEVGATKIDNITLPAYWCTDWDGRTTSHLMERYSYDDIWIYLPIDPDVTRDEIRITVTGQIKTISDYGGGVFIDGTAKWERSDPDNVGPTIDFSDGEDLDDDAVVDIVTQPVTYIYPLDFKTLTG